MPRCPRSLPRLARCLLSAALAGCIGDLRELPVSDGSPAAERPRDLGAARDLAAAMMGVGYAPVIQADLDRLGCSANACHGGAAPMRVVMGATGADLADNYREVLLRSRAGAQSALLQKNLKGSPLGHVGGQPFATPADPDYRRWRDWIEAGAPAGSALAPDDAGVDAAPSDEDM